MSARIALEVAYRSGLSVSVQNGRLCLRADEAPPPAVLAQIKVHRNEILLLLTAEADANDAHVAAWVEWNERAAIMEYDGGMTRAEAENVAAKVIRLDKRREK